MGDGVLVYFGYPQAHEDDAERAVRAGLELVAAVGGLKTDAPLQTCVGIATGLVVVVRACMEAGLVKGEGFAVDASVIEADASRYHGKAADEIDWSAPERQTRAVAEFLSSLDDEDSGADRKLPKN